MHAILLTGMLLAAAAEASTVVCTALCRFNVTVNNSSERVFSVITATGGTGEAAVIELNRKCAGGTVVGGIRQFPASRQGPLITNADFNATDSCVVIP